MASTSQASFTKAAVVSSSFRHGKQAGEAVESLVQKILAKDTSVIDSGDDRELVLGGLY